MGPHGFGSGRNGGSGSNRSNENFGGNWKVKKLDLPIFTGTNPDGWILRAERYFQFYRLGEEETLEAATGMRFFGINGNMDDDPYETGQS